MRKLIDLLPISSPLNHSYIVVGDPQKILIELKEYFEQRFGVGFTSSNNPDFRLDDFLTWGVDESRELKIFNSLRPVSWSAKVCIVVPGVITLQAQNSLLKTLEEPSAGTHFFIITRRLEEYLPTVISRCQVLKLEAGIFPSELIKLAEDWLSSDISRRFEITKNILKNQENNQTYISKWLNCLLDVFWNKVSDRADKKISNATQSLLTAIIYSGQRGASFRVILEHLAGLIPTV